MTKAPETITVENDIDEVSCDGGGGALGHPKVWYTFDGQDSVECGYCDRLFVKKRVVKGSKAS
ncbi:MAG: zinc-finger domain-containing protein [Alphaproteobacteria bacterium]|nr:zinc-finger domain-containing protein [Alphaproteobacteria bacterium]MCD8519839.1 zinc-finger domain-containing protein [Alphaproteobacteria bacterium]MCD8526483.1 zinc-finger domain-containing protein [Alphaproteobacteria bacterium]MCD8570376.1 zinc-finger domain-containing protein [Alphaproteobacteria bacterium]